MTLIDFEYSNLWFLLKLNTIPYILGEKAPN